MKKEIEFIGPSGERVTHQIDLGMIEAGATRRLVLGIASTWNGNPDESLVLVQSRITVKERIYQEWSKPGHQSNQSLPDYFKSLEVYGPGYLDSKPLSVWRWDRMSEGEAPLDYINRQMILIALTGDVWRCALEPAWMNAPQALQYLESLGGTVSIATIYRAMESGAIQARSDDPKTAMLGSVVKYAEKLGLMKKGRA